MEKISSLKMFVMQSPTLGSYYPGSDENVQKKIDDALDFNVAKLRPCFLKIFKIMVKMKLRKEQQEVREAKRRGLAKHDESTEIESSVMTGASIMK